MVLKADCDDVREVLKDIYKQVYLCINPNLHYADVSLVYQLLTESYGIIIIKLGRKTASFHQFPPEIIYTELFCHNIIQTLIVLGNVVDVAVVADGLEVTTGTFDFTFLRATELRTLEVIAFGLCHEIDVLDTSFLEGYCPVRIVLSHRRIDIEAIGKFRIDSNLITRFQLISEVHLNAF